MKRKILSLVFVLWLVLSMPMTAMALDFIPGKKGSVSVELMEQDGKTPIVGVELSIYHVATVGRNSSYNLGYEYTESFADCGASLDDTALAEKLDSFVSSNTAAAQKLKTDSEGKAVFSDLTLGLYFVKQTNSVSGYAPCKSFLVTVPYKSGDGYIYDVNASPKTDIERLMDITIKKVWNTDKSTPAASSVTVQLLCDSTVVKTVSLNQQNNWKVTYEDMPASDAYSIVEVNIPKGFKATYSQNANVFTVTNTASLAQTGQLIWPIPVLALLGLLLITVGSIALKKSRNKNA